MTYSALEQKYNNIYLCISDYFHGCTFRFKVNFPHAVNIGTGYYINFNVTSNFDDCNVIICRNNVTNPATRETCSFTFNSMTMGNVLQISSMSQLSTGPINNVSWEVKLFSCPFTRNDGKGEKRSLREWYDSVFRKPKIVGGCQPAPTAVPFIEVWDPTPSTLQTVTTSGDFARMDNLIFLVCGSADPTDYSVSMSMVAQGEDQFTALAQYGCNLNDTDSNFCLPKQSSWSNANPSALNIVTNALLLPNALTWTVRGQGQNSIPNKYLLSLRQNAILAKK